MPVILSTQPHRGRLEGYHARGARCHADLQSRFPGDQRPAGERRSRRPRSGGFREAVFPVTMPLSWFLALESSGWRERISSSKGSTATTKSPCRAGQRRSGSPDAEVRELLVDPLDPSLQDVLVRLLRHTGIQPHEPVAQAVGELRVVRAHDHRRPGGRHVPDDRLDLAARLFVHVRGGFVQEEHPRRQRERPREGDALLLSAREGGRAAALESRKPDPSKGLGCPARRASARRMPRILGP